MHPKLQTLSGRLAAFFLILLAVSSAAFPADVEALDVRVRVVTDEADAALAVLDERAASGTVKPESWDRLWKSEGFVRLKKAGRGARTSWRRSRREPPRKREDDGSSRG